MPFLATRRDLGDRTFIDFSHSSDRSLGLFSLVGILLQSSVIEPHVVIARLVSKFLLVLDPSLAEHCSFNSCTVAKLLLKVGVRCIELSRARAWQAIESELMDIVKGISQVDVIIPGVPELTL